MVLFENCVAFTISYILSASAGLFIGQTASELRHDGPFIIGSFVLQLFLLLIGCKGFTRILTDFLVMLVGFDIRNGIKPLHVPRNKLLFCRDQPKNQTVLDQKLDLNLSQSENALNLLNHVLSCDLSEEINSCILYCIEVLKSNADELNIPLALMRRKTRSRRSLLTAVDSDREIDVDVHQWLMSQFSRSCSAENSEINHRQSIPGSAADFSQCSSPKVKANGSFDSSSSRKPSSWAIEATQAADAAARAREAQPPPLPATYGAGVLFAGAPRPPGVASPQATAAATTGPAWCGGEEAPGGEDLPFAAGPEERRAMLEALEGVDGWEWDVFRLRQASAGRELQVSLPPRARRRSSRRTPALPLTGFEEHESRDAENSWIVPNRGAQQKIPNRCSDRTFHPVHGKDPKDAFSSSQGLIPQAHPDCKGSYNSPAMSSTCKARAHGRPREATGSHGKVTVRSLLVSA